VNPVKGSTILIVDDEPELALTLARLVSREGLTPVLASDGPSALHLVRSEHPDVILLDFRMPGMDGMEVMRRAKRLDEDLPVILITAFAEVRGAVEAMRAGAYDYLAKPFNHQEVIRMVLGALGERDLKRRLEASSSQAHQDGSLREIFGPSAAVGRLIADAGRVAKANFSVVILGETGSGKEVIARAIHAASPRARGPFIPLDCGAIPETLLESELFGHERGAFTGADRQKPGTFEAARGGTLFLDEVSNMPLLSQAKLLRTLQEKVIYRVGGSRPIGVDVRLLAASNDDLERLSESGTFRRDLYYRLNEFTLRIPPLRERTQDIPYLAQRFMDITNAELSKRVSGFSEPAMQVLLDHNWPGNVRQLRSAIRRAVLLAGEVVTEAELELDHRPVPGAASQPVAGLNGSNGGWAGLPLREIVKRNTRRVEREVIEQVLRTTGGNKAKAARLLQVDYKTIHSKVKEYSTRIEGE
jgi:two-component system nitrogen regulation response regulator GlnG